MLDRVKLYAGVISAMKSVDLSDADEQDIMELAFDVEPGFTSLAEQGFISDDDCPTVEDIAVWIRDSHYGTDAIGVFAYAMKLASARRDFFDKRRKLLCTRGCVARLLDQHGNVAIGGFRLEEIRRSLACELYQLEHDALKSGLVSDEELDSRSWLRRNKVSEV